MKGNAMKMLLATATMLAGVLTAGCQPSPLSHQDVALRPLADCAELEQALKRGALEKMRQRLLGNLDWALEGGGRWYEEDAGMGDCSGGLCGAPSESPASRDEAGEYSTTNNQEAGVDEADFVKNDGGYIYLLAGDGLMIIDAWPPEQTHVVSRTTVEGTPRKLFVHAGKALVYSEIYNQDNTPAYDYDCYYWGDCRSPATGLVITVLDISDLAAPRLERTIKLSGALTGARRIGNAIYSVVNFRGPVFEGIAYWPSDIDMCTASQIEILLAFQRLLDENERIIRAATLEDFLPEARDTRYLADGGSVEQAGPFGRCRGFYEPTVTTGAGFITVLSTDISDPRHLEASSIVGDDGTVYASTGALYLATSYGGGKAGEQESEYTAVHKFALHDDPPAASYTASGTVDGRLLNQFSLGEYNGDLRLATTTGHVSRGTSDNPSTNSVFVLRQRGRHLDVIGELRGLGLTEDIRSARFVGSRGFVVTFKKTDPLYTIDLSNPARPRVGGELKIPGFSTYIHMMDADHLLTIGFDAEDQGSFAWFQGIQLQIFDVADLDRPTLLHKTVIGTRGTSSEATGNHLAFNYFPPRDILALPMALCTDSGGGGNYGSNLEFSGLMVWDVTVAGGFHERGRVAFAEPDYSADGCYNWWTNPHSRVKRSIIMDDYVFSLSENLLKVNHLDALGQDLVTLDIPPIPEPEYNYGY